MGIKSHFQVMNRVDSHRRTETKGIFCLPYTKVYVLVSVIRIIILNSATLLQI